MSEANDKKLQRVIENYGNSLYRMCLVILGNEQDTEDVMQETFIKYMQKAPVFLDDTYEKAWLLRVANNLCKDMIRFRKRHTHENIENLGQYYTMEDEKLILREVMSLPVKYSQVLILYYIEGYKPSEISLITKCSQSAARKRIERGVKLLKSRMKEGI